ncbi:Nif11-like leader peptide family natural product precursor [bacterium SCSIO 12741]|nr:Nif11-like leader peptide family natural product precursor [bacterium SCSIO 12741]
MKKLIEALNNDEALRNEFNNAVNNSIVEVAKKHGINVTTQDLEASEKDYSASKVGDSCTSVLFTAVCTA